MKDVQGIEFTEGRRVAYIGGFQGSTIYQKVGYVSRLTAKTVFVVTLQKDIGIKLKERSIKPSRAVVIGI